MKLGFMTWPRSLLAVCCAVSGLSMAPQDPHDKCCCGNPLHQSATIGSPPTLPGQPLFLATEISAAQLSGVEASPPEPHTFLKTYLDFSEKDLRRMEGGKAVVKSPPSHDKSEVAVVGVIRIRATMEFFLERYRKVELLKSDDGMLQIGKISSPEGAEDFAALRLEPGDLEELRRCRVGRCKIKLPGWFIERVRRELDGGSGASSANALFQEMLLAYVRDYLARGNCSLMEYNDHPEPLKVADCFLEVLKGSPYLDAYYPEFHRYLKDYPEFELGGVEDFLYWSKVSFGLKPVISVTHASIFRPSVRNARVIASKQIYASHYFNASLGLTFLVPVEGNPSDADGFYLLYLNRSRANHLGGFFSGIKHSIIGRRLRSAMKKNLIRTRQRLEAGYQARLDRNDDGPH